MAPTRIRKYVALAIAAALVGAACSSGAAADTKTRPDVTTTATAESNSTDATSNGSEESEGTFLDAGGQDNEGGAPFPETVRMPYLSGWTNQTVYENGQAQEVALVYRIGDKLELISMYTNWAESALEPGSTITESADEWTVTGTVANGGEQVRVAIINQVFDGTTMASLFITWDF